MTGGQVDEGGRFEGVHTTGGWDLTGGQVDRGGRFEGLHTTGGWDLTGVRWTEVEGSTLPVGGI